MRVVRAFVVLFFTSFLALPPGAVPRADAHVAATCWGEWSTERTDCHFLLRGFPIEAWGDVAGDGEVSIRIRVEVFLDVVRFQDPVLVFHECEGTGTGEASCEATFGPEQILNVPFADNVHALCIVEGVGAGSFACRSGTGT